MNDFPYITGENGWRPDPLDTRDIPIEAVLGAPEAMPSEYDVIQAKLGGQIKVEDQGRSLSCVGQTFSKYKEILDTIELGHPVDLSAKFMYSRIFLARYGGGAYLRDAAQLLVMTGVSEEALDPSYQAGTLTEEYMRIINSGPAVLENAIKYKAKAYVTVTGGVNVIKQAILNGNGMPTSSNVSWSGWGGQPLQQSGGYVAMPKPGEEISGHAYLLVGWSDQRQAFKVLNSFSKNWGLGGFAWLRYSDIAWLGSGWTVVDVPNELIEAARSMYNLRRHPARPESVYAVTGKVWRHIANVQTLNLGNVGPDRYWIVPDGGILAIPVATPEEMVGVVETDEIHIDPKD